MKEIYDWVPWFRALARKIAEGGEQYLIDKAKTVEWGGKANPALLQYRDENIDPFSFFYFLAQRNTTNLRPIVYPSVSEQFHIESILPNADAFIFPTPSHNAQVLFHDGETFRPDLLWKLFRQVVGDNPNVDPEDFRKVLGIKQVGVTKLTQALFLINAEYFLPVDSSTEVVSAIVLEEAFPGIKEGIKDNGYGKV